MPQVGEIIYEVTCSACPVQIEGTAYDVPFYFRARGNRWAIYFDNPTLDAPPYTGGHYGDGPYDAGYMSVEEALEFIAGAARHYLNEGSSDTDY
jgi:hypothetical protein